MPRVGLSPVLCFYAKYEQEDCMPFVTGDVVPSPGEETPFKVVFKQGETVLAQWPVDSKEAGEEEVLELIKDLVDD